jgi:hypothetical protein
LWLTVPYHPLYLAYTTGISQLKLFFYFHSDHPLHWRYIPLTVWLCLILLPYIILKMQFLSISIFVLLNSTSNIRCIVWPFANIIRMFLKILIDLNSQKWNLCYRKRRLTELECFLVNRKYCRLSAYVLIAGTNSSSGDALGCLHRRKFTMFWSYCSKASVLKQTVLHTWTFRLIIHTEHYSEDYVK